MAAVLALLAISSRAEAQSLPRQRGFAVNRLELSERGSEWFALDSLDLRGKVRPAFGLAMDYSTRPIVARDPEGNDLAELVASQLFLDPSASVVLFDRLRLGALVPIAVSQSGDSFTSSTRRFRPPESTLGDIRMSADLRLVGTHGDPFTTAIGASLYAPTGSRKNYTSDGNTRFAPHLLFAGDISFVTYSARAAYHYRPLTERYDGRALGSQLELGAAIGVRGGKDDGHLIVGPEIFSSTVTREEAFFKKHQTDVEAILGAHYTYKDVRFGGGVGGAILNAIGSPKIRALLTLEWTPHIEEAPPPPPPPPPYEDKPLWEAAPLLPLPPPPPAPPPPPDRDGDQVPDGVDACPDVPGVASDDRLANGCPGDRDDDGIIDKEDACPDLAGTASSNPNRNGCPLVRIDDDQIRIMDQFHFKASSAEILAESNMLTLTIASTMKTHPEIKKLRVEGHTDNSGNAAANVKLSQARADAVVKALIKAGVDKKRLSAKGVGQMNPVDSNSTPEGRAANRRVELHILKE